MRSKPALDRVRRIKKPKETSRERRRASVRRTKGGRDTERKGEKRVLEKAGGERRRWGGIRIQREENSSSSSERHAETQERTKGGNVRGRDCMTAAQKTNG